MPQPSLTAINALGLTPDAAILDVGGGASTLAAELVAAGHTDVTVLDLAASALDHAQDQHGGQSREIKCTTADIRDHAFDRRFDLWYDRAVFHFMVSDSDRASYVQTLERSLEPRGPVIIATFGPDGPTRCSDLPVHRYGRRAGPRAARRPRARRSGARRAPHPVWQLPAVPPCTPEQTASLSAHWIEKRPLTSLASA